MLTFEGFDPADEGRRETLCTLGNGVFATRGAAPESSADEVHYPGTYVAGCYNRLSSQVAGHVVENESLVNMPNWLPLSFCIDDGPWFRLDDTEILDYGVELDLRQGLLTRRVRLRDGESRCTTVTQRRFVHMGQPHVAALESTITAENWSGDLNIRSGIDGTVENAGVPRYRALGGRHLVPQRLEQTDPDTVLLVARTSQSQIGVAVAARTRILRDGQPTAADTSLDRGQGWVAQRATTSLSAGQTMTAEKVVTLFTSHDKAISEPAVATTDLLAGLDGFASLLESHRIEWDQLWRQVQIDFDGDEQTLRALRLNTFHLLQTLSPNTADLDAGVPARGLHGEAYRGHVFWDELFTFPLYTLRFTRLSRSLLSYRHRRLPAARRAATEAGHTGAMFPWQSGSDGREESQRWHLNPMSGQWSADVTHRQRHVGLAVAYNVWQHFQATGDQEYLADSGAETLVEVARFWASLAQYDEGRARHSLRGVMGPDEFHTGYPDRIPSGIDDNAYTNVMCSWVLRRTLEALERLPVDRHDHVVERLGIEPAERERWYEVSARLVVPFHDDGVISQFDGYEKLQELDWAAYRQRYGDIARLDRILEAEGDSPNRYKVSKQADVLMLFYLFSAEELDNLFRHLGYDFRAETIPRTVSYYLPRTTHGSTLSAVVHGWVLARGNRQEAGDHIARALASDVSDVNAGTVAEGVHLGAMAGSVDLFQRCFAGVELRDDTLWVNPMWPPKLGTLELWLRYRGHLLLLEANGRRARISSVSGPTAQVRCGSPDATALIGPGEQVEFGS